MRIPLMPASSVQKAATIVMGLEIRGRRQPPLEHDMMGIYVVDAEYIPALW